MAATDASVTISRRHQEDVRQRQIIVRIDDGPKKPLTFGAAVTFQIAPGDHRLHADNTLFKKTVPFTIGPGDRLEFVVINRAGRGTMGFLALLGVGPLYLSVEQKT